MLQSYKELKVWQKSYQFCLDIYKMTKNFEYSEAYGLVAQMRRASVSIPSNIAEGYRRRHKAEYLQFLRIAYGSCAELDTQINLSKDLGFISRDTYDYLIQDCNEISRMLFGLIKSIEAIK